MPAILIAPSEGPLLKSLGTVSALPEKYGADILWAEPKVEGLVGVQRKEYTDLLNSVDDGRLSKEIAQLTTMTKAAFLVVEGRPHWTVEGFLNHKWLNHWTRERWRSLLRDAQMRGVVVEFTDDVADTIAYVESLSKWLAKGEHHSLDRRPKETKERWGQKTSRSFGRWILQGIDGIGPTHADAIIDHCDGIPLTWTMTEKELAAIKGLGPKKVAAMTKAILAKPESV